uniref:Uncharacterized protein n=1 Tax=Solanum lycopersicum TaxID=4081 RepID=A0A3Q7J8X8_SOLLC
MQNCNVRQTCELRHSTNATCRLDARPTKSCSKERATIPTASSSLSPLIRATGAS